MGESNHDASRREPSGVSSWRDDANRKQKCRDEREDGGGLAEAPGIYEHALLPDDIGFLIEAGYRQGELLRIAALAHARRCAPSELMIARGDITRNAYLRCLARRLCCAFQEAEPDPDSLVIPDCPDDAGAVLWSLPSIAKMHDGSASRFLVAPTHHDSARLVRLQRRMPGAFRAAVLIEPEKLRRAIFDRMRSRISTQAQQYLATRYPEFSARWRLSGNQKLVGVLSAGFLAIGMAVAPRILTAVLACLLSAIYFLNVGFRACLVARTDLGFPSGDRTGRRKPETEYPLYSVLVPLYREANQIDDLVESLEDIDWPARRIEIKLVCEADDEETISVIRRKSLPDQFQLVICPGSEPRTKPKALNFALPLCTGEFVVIYDAEDRPHPRQLQEAWSRFRAGDHKLACLQAPLGTSNRQQNWLTKMFAMEYDTLFRGSLPACEGLTSLLPLGGTSNHFRADSLKAVGAWDPYNMTEDADLGIRLARCGLRSGVLSLPTIGEAPPVMRIWFGQRTRWLKGWFQTMLVHLRDPARTARDLGWGDWLFMHFFITTHILSVLFHPIFLVFALVQFFFLSATGTISAFGAFMLALAGFNLAGGFSTYVCLALAVRRRDGISTPSAWYLATLPIYWLLISFAGWAAIGQLIIRPFHWEKTPHGLANADDDANIGR